MNHRGLNLAMIAVTAFVVSGCSAPVSNDFRARMWEKCYVAGESQYRRGNYDDAGQLLREAAKQARMLPSGEERVIETDLLLGECLLAQKQPGEALAVFSKLSSVLHKKKDSTSWLRALLGEADAELALGNLANAEKTYRQITALNPADSLDPEHGYDMDGLALARAYEGLAETLSREGKPEEALAPLKQAAGIADWTVAMLEWKDALRHRHLSTLWAVGRDNEAVKDTPNKEWAAAVKDAYRNMTNGNVEALERSAQDADAMIVGSGRESNLSHAVSAVVLANAAFYKGDYDKAIKLAKQGLDIRAKDGMAKFDTISGDLHQVIGLSEEAQGHLEAAAVDLQSAFDIERAIGSGAALKLASCMAQLATVEQKLGNADAGRDAISRALVFADAGHRGIRFGIAQYWISRYYQETGNTKEALAHAGLAYGKLRRINPNHILALKLKSKFPKLEPVADQDY